MPINEDNPHQRIRRSKMVELAGMLKEKRKGTARNLEGILFRFCVQEGVKPDTAREYLNCLKEVGVIRTTNGKKQWQYNSDAEWELFKVTI